MSNIQILKATPLSPDQLKDYYKRETNETLKVVLINSIKESDTIDSIFGKNNCFILFLPVLSTYNGHFVSLFRTNKGIFFFDSYGNTPKKLLENINNLEKVKVRNTLFKIIAQGNVPCFYNTVLYQTKTEEVADCGRYSVANCVLFTLHQKQNKEYNLLTFNKKIIEHMKEHNLKDYDDAITDITKDLQ